METLPAIKSIDDLNRYADIMLKSGFFSDIKSAAQACVKIMAGQELGIPPIASMRGIYIVRGQILMSSQTMASLIKRSGRYNYKVSESTSEQCIIEFFENGEACGESRYSIEDAKKAKLVSSDTWQKYPQMMLFNRAMSNGAKMFCADIFHGPSYIEGEIEDAVDAGESPRDIPDMASTPHEPEPALASKGQIGVLFGHLKRLGVRDGDKQRLIDFVYPNGLIASKCTEDIRELKSATEKIPRGWFGKYVDMLLTGHPWYDKAAVDTFCEKSFGDKKYKDWTTEDVNKFLDWLIMVEKPEEEPETGADDVMDLSEVAVEPSPWLAVMAEVQSKTGESPGEIEKWLLQEYGRGHYQRVEDMPVEGIRVIEAMDAAMIKKSMDSVPMI